MYFYVIEIIMATESLEFVKHVSWNKMEVIYNFWEGWRNIKIPVGGTISNYIAF